MSQKKKDRESAYRTIKLITLLYGMVFFVAISMGYYLLFGGALVGAVIGIVAALIAVSIAKLLGSEEKGISNNVPLFATLLILSAVGVFNSLMLNFEGRQIFTAATKSAGTQLDELEFAYKKNVPEGIQQAALRIDKIESTADRLYEEILNRSNCGQGSEALRLIGELKSQLPTFTTLSQGGGSPCAHAQELVDSYKSTIPKLYAATEWYRAANYGDWLAGKRKLLDEKVGFIPEAKRTLAELQAQINVSRGPNLVRSVKPALEDLDSRYREAVTIVKSNLTEVGSAKPVAVTPELDLLSVRSVGEWSQLINLILDNLNKPTTYVYPTLAVFADWLMVYLFGQVRSRRVRVTRTNESADILRS